MVEPYLGLRDDLARGAYANYIAELLDRFTADEEDDSGELFALLDATMSRGRRSGGSALGGALL